MPTIDCCRNYVFLSAKTWKQDNILAFSAVFGVGFWLNALKKEEGCRKYAFLFDKA